jgi:hypothetical protein
MVPLVFRFNHFWGKCILLRFSQNDPSSYRVKSVSSQFRLQHFHTESLRYLSEWEQAAHHLREIEKRDTRDTGRDEIIMKLERITESIGMTRKILLARVSSSRPTSGTTSLRNCAPLPQVQSKGYHIGKAVT